MIPPEHATRTPPARPPAEPPRALRPGARVALVAPAGPVTTGRIGAARADCARLSLEPVVFPAAAARHRYLAGTDEQRLADLQEAFDDPSIDTVWALRGGYGTLRIIDGLDLARQLRDPIPFIGFSDNTSIHALHAALGVISFHGPHPGSGLPDETLESLRRVLFSPEPLGRLEPRPCDPAPRKLVPGQVEAPLVGGNLAILASMCGTAYAPVARGAILFLEDVGEPAYRVDRMLLQLMRSGLTEGVAGLAFGRFTDAPGEADHPVGDVLAEFAERLGVPAVVDLPFGHIDHNVTLPVGGLALLDADAAALELTCGAVR
jgi:muramoyltetrapeptide carboxypeptidase